MGLAGTARFSCSVGGFPAPTAYWAHEGSSLLLLPGQRAAGGRVTVGRDNSLSIGRVGEDDGGYYACVAVGGAGAALARAHLQVQSKYA